MISGRQCENGNLVILTTFWVLKLNTHQLLSRSTITPLGIKLRQGFLLNVPSCYSKQNHQPSEGKQKNEFAGTGTKTCVCYT